MSNHIHLIVSCKKSDLSDVLRDYKKYTAKQIVTAIESNQKESRKNWLLWLLKREENIISGNREIILKRLEAWTFSDKN